MFTIEAREVFRKVVQKSNTAFLLSITVRYDEKVHLITRRGNLPFLECSFFYRLCFSQYCVLLARGAFVRNLVRNFHAYHWFVNSRKKRTHLCPATYEEHEQESWNETDKNRVVFQHNLIIVRCMSQKNVMAGLLMLI